MCTQFASDTQKRTLEIRTSVRLPGYSGKSKMATSMEVQPSSSKDVSDTVLASSGSSGSVSVALHPLVIMNISEHYTRIKAQYGKPDPQGRF